MITFKQFCNLVKETENYKILKKEGLTKKWFNNYIRLNEDHFEDDYMVTFFLHNKFSSLLYGSFTLYDTEEGWEFWHKYYNKYKKIENEKRNQIF